MRGIDKKIKSEITKVAASWVSSASLRRYSRSGLDLVFPPQPLWVSRGRSSMAHIKLIDEPQCAVCGFPFAYDLGAEVLCGNCTARQPVYDRARAAFIYDQQSRQPILSFKHGGQTHGLPVFAQQLARAGRALFADADKLIPVPLHPRRLRQRRFNQAALLGKALSRLKKIPLDSASLYRIKATDSQGGKSMSGRRRNMQGAFKIAEARGEAIKGQNIILVDDVLTTGATVEACADVLKRAGAAQVSVLTLARVIREDSLNRDGAGDTFV